MASADADLLSRPLSFLGVLLIALGVVLVALPLIARYLPSLEKVPPILLWVYRSDGFYFVTSPILIIISLASILLWLIRR